MPSAKGPLHSGVATRLLRGRRGEGGVGRPRERQIPSLSLSATSVVTVRARELQDEYERQGRRWPPPALPSLHAHARHGLPLLRPPPSSLNDCARLSLNSVPGVAPPKEHLLRNAGVTARDNAPWQPPLAKGAPTKGRGKSSRRLLVPGRDAKLGRAARASQGIACGAKTSRAMGCFFQRLVVLGTPPRVPLRRRAV